LGAQDRNLDGNRSSIPKAMLKRATGRSSQWAISRACAARGSRLSTGACIGNSNSSRKRYAAARRSRSLRRHSRYHRRRVADRAPGVLSLQTQLMTTGSSNYYKLTDTALTRVSSKGARRFRRASAMSASQIVHAFPEGGYGLACRGIAAAVRPVVREAAVVMADRRGSKVAKLHASGGRHSGRVSACLPAAQKKPQADAGSSRQCVGGAPLQEGLRQRCIPEIKCRSRCPLEVCRRCGRVAKAESVRMQEVPGGRTISLATCTKEAGRDPAKLAGLRMGNIPSAITVCFTASGSSSAQIQDGLNKADGRFARLKKAARLRQGRGRRSGRSSCAHARTIFIPATPQNSRSLPAGEGGDPKAALTTCGSLPPNVGGDR